MREGPRLKRRKAITEQCNCVVNRLVFMLIVGIILSSEFDLSFFVRSEWVLARYRGMARSGVVGEAGRSGGRGNSIGTWRRYSS